ncbi:LysR family transcriptional regulator [uncultured Aquabacterium sp.]|jgi:DNA-binding transcriptional LysR family regulator|uniref:LysR family transcriptional regulator n=1 Tax=uncultured Aquabacterium sp. TaxID=158753 RepID=UPI00261D5E90|nr:LysR family transcriptional regulator [uncultured Aquabacterium sp.]
MSKSALFDKIDLSLIRVLHTVITECSVSRAAIRLQSSQPAVSAQLRRLRELTGDPLLVRCGQSMAPTDVALSLLEPASAILQHAQAMFGHKSAVREFDPATTTLTFRIAATDYLDPCFLPELTLRLRRLAPHVRVEVVPLTSDLDYRRSLARGEVDLVIGNWLEPSDELHLGRLLTDEVVCLVSEDHPAARLPKEGKRAWTVEQYLAAEHIAPPPLHPGAVGIIDEHLAMQGLRRNIVVRNPHFAQLPYMVAGSLLVLTTGRRFCERYARDLKVRLIRCPVSFPSLNYYQLWHDLTHHSAASRWLREQVRDVVRGLHQVRPPVRDAADSPAAPPSSPARVA